MFSFKSSMFVLPFYNKRMYMYVCITIHKRTDMAGQTPQRKLLRME